MTAWLAPLHRALDGLPRPVPVFFRDDDAGWEDGRLSQLLDLFRLHRMPIDLAVIPDALTPALAGQLLKRRTEPGGTIGLHQHGKAHRNHQPTGRPCEFGPARTPADVRADLHAGRARLTELLGPAVDPIFTPPWNRCSKETVCALRELEFAALSRDRTAEPLALPGLLELPITVDWFAKRGGVRLALPAFGASLARAFADAGLVGLMLHHAVTEADDFHRIEQLLALLAGHPRVQSFPMMALVAERVVVS
jgi:peptidoglycan/xylan/chitin deacetylase (PgdA/CDA1 family)